jgi:hypothetical protein
MTQFPAELHAVAGVPPQGLLETLCRRDIEPLLVIPRIIDERASQYAVRHRRIEHILHDGRAVRFSMRKSCRYSFS